VITFKVSCPDHGDVDVSVDDMLIAESVFLVHCSEVDHLFLQQLTPRVESALVVCGVERLCP
jgi:hypothetical protein